MIYACFKRNKRRRLSFLLSASLISVVCLASAHVHVRNPACCLVCCIIPRSLSHLTDLIFQLNINHATRSCSQCSAKKKREENNGKGSEGTEEIRSTQVGVKVRGASERYTRRPNTVDHNSFHCARGIWDTGYHERRYS
jgi:hypothetical protein